MRLHGQPTALLGRPTDVRWALVVVVLLVSACSGADRPAAAPATPPATTAQSNAPTTTPAPVGQLEGLPTGPPPRVAYADGDAVVHPDGRRERLVGQKRIGVTALTRYRDGWLVADERFFEGTVGLAYVAGGDRTDLGPCASSGASLSGDGRRATWMTQGCPEAYVVAPTLVHVSPTTGTGEEQREVDRIGITSAVGFLGDEVVVSGYDGVTAVGPGGVVRRLPRLRYATDTSDRRGLVAGLLPDGDAHAAVLDGRSGELLWDARRTYLDEISPSGVLVAGYVRGRPAILETDSGRVIALAESGLDLLDWVWEDDRHLVGVASRGARQAMVRIDLRGNVTRIGPVVRAKGWRFVFETRP